MTNDEYRLFAIECVVSASVSNGGDESVKEQAYRLCSRIGLKLDTLDRNEEIERLKQYCDALIDGTFADS